MVDQEWAVRCAKEGGATSFYCWLLERHWAAASDQNR